MRHRHADGARQDRRRTCVGVVLWRPGDRAASASKGRRPPARPRSAGVPDGDQLERGAARPSATLPGPTEKVRGERPAHAWSAIRRGSGTRRKGLRAESRWASAGRRSRCGRCHACGVVSKLLSLVCRVFSCCRRVPAGVLSPLPTGRCLTPSGFGGSHAPKRSCDTNAQPLASVEHSPDRGSSNGKLTEKQIRKNTVFTSALPIEGPRMSIASRLRRTNQSRSRHIAHARAHPHPRGDTARHAVVSWSEPAR